MDLETENRVAALLMEEARRLRLQADKEGVHVYLRKNNIRGRPNSRFLAATVLGVEQANRAVEVSEMWHARKKELDLEGKLNSRSKEDRHNRSRGKKHNESSVHLNFSSRQEREDRTSEMPCSASKPNHKDRYSIDDHGLRDDEVEEFLLSRAKRGRGAIGSRMDEPGPYLPLTSADQDGQLLLNSDVRVKEDWESRILGPQKPDFHELFKYDSGLDDTSDSRKPHTKEKKRSKKDKSGKEKGKEKRSKHHHKSRRRN